MAGIFPAACGVPSQANVSELCSGLWRPIPRPLGRGFSFFKAIFMRRDIRVFLAVCLTAFCASFVVQTVFQSVLGGEKSVWGGNPGWQREIAFWNVGMGLVVLQTLRLGEDRLAIAVAQSCTLLFLLLGVNHAYAFAQNPAAYFHWPPLVLNAVGFVYGLRLLLSRREG